MTYDSTTTTAEPGQRAGVVRYGQTVTVLDQGTLTNSVHPTFNGWNTDVGGLGTPYAATDTFPMPEGNVTSTRSGSDLRQGHFDYGKLITVPTKYPTLLCGLSTAFLLMIAAAFSILSRPYFRSRPVNCSTTRTRGSSP